MVAAILVAAGVGKRFGPGTDKLFLEAAGRPVIAHTWARFDQVPEIDEIVLVVRAGLEPDFRTIASTLPLRKPWHLAPGGKERQDSVWNGLLAVSPGAEVVAIQDGARPCTAATVISATVAAARATGAAVTAQRMTDTVKESDDGATIARTLDRSRLWAVQTPQAFRREVILRALQAVRDSGAVVTDDTAACERIGQPVALVESREPNPKITYPGDVAFLEWLLRQGDSRVRG